MPTLEELANLYDNIQENLYSLDWAPKCQLALDEKYSNGEALFLGIELPERINYRLVDKNTYVL